MGAQRLVEVGPVGLELGETLPAVTLAYETWGTPQHDNAGNVSNAVLVLHALTGDAHVPGWWGGILGPGHALDTDHWFVVASNVLGGCRGTTGPASPAADGDPWGSRFPRITIRDQVLVEALLADELGIDRYAAVLGGSMGGMRALEWLVGYPERVGSALVLAVGAEATADQIGLQTTQLNAIRQDPAWLGGDYGDGPGPVAGLGLARQIAHLSYRSELELDARFGRDPQAGEDPLRDGRYAVQSYLDHHAEKLIRRFDARSYVTLTEAMNTHDIGRGRGGIAAALDRVTAPTLVAGISTDRLYPLRLQSELAQLIPTCESLDVVDSPYGHDGFLIETEAVAKLIGATLDAVTEHRSGPQPRSGHPERP